MANKGKLVALSKELEEQIQNLAGDIYIQVEDKLTHFVRTTLTQETTQPIPQQTSKQKPPAETVTEKIEQNPRYIALKTELQADLKSVQQQLSQTQQALTEKNNQQLEEIATLKRHNDTQEHLLAEEKSLIAKAQVEIVALTEQLAVITEQEQGIESRLNIVEQQRDNNEAKFVQAKQSWQEQDDKKLLLIDELQKKIVKVTQALNKNENELADNQKHYQQVIEKNSDNAEQKESLLIKQLQQTKQQSDEYHQQLTTEQKTVALLQENIQHGLLVEEQSKKTLLKLTDELASAERKRSESDVIATERLASEQQKKACIEKQLHELQNQHQLLEANLVTEQADIKLYQQEVIALKEQLTLAQEGQENMLSRFNNTREKQERENTQVRETIKYLRDENNSLINQHNEKEQQILEQMAELETKVTEYRLKFEYAQKQLTSNSE